MQKGITIPTIEKIKEEGNSAVFVISPLFSGYGVTVGNSLRRILYSSLSGAAIYSVKVDGATHEFSTLPGVKEDLIQIILNLKKIRLKLHEGEEATLKLNAKGPKEVESSDIKCPSSVEIINPHQYVANLGKTGKLSMELHVNKGLGYIPIEAREEEKYPLGTVAIDAIYSPIQKVNYSVEQTRVGKMTNYDKLIIEITTDGTIKAEEALKKAAEILIDQLKIIKEFTSKIKSEKKKIQVSQEKVVEEKISDIKSKKVEEAGFSKRTVNALINNKIKTVAGLARLSEETLNEMKGLGNKGIEEIKIKLKNWEMV